MQIANIFRYFRKKLQSGLDNPQVKYAITNV